MKKVIIAGNGPSLKEIDYSRLPNDFDVFRCNQFYFEDKYYLGKKCKAVFYTPNFFFEQYYTLKHLIQNQEYETELIMCSNYNQAHLENENFVKTFTIIFLMLIWDMIFLNNLKNLMLILNFTKFISIKELPQGSICVQ